MYNRTSFNRTPFNRKARFEFEWTATANAETGSGGSVIIIRYLGGSAAAESSATGEIIRVVLPSGVAEAVTEATGDYIHTVFLEGETEAVTYANGSSLSTYGQEVLTIEGVNMNAGDELIIDTEHMTVTLNGVNIVDRVSDASVFFKLKDGVNEIVVEGGTTADIKILWKDRWL
jgi:hypothetical protein